ncbi:MAG: triose-phosphate isomerase [Bacillota bacterium]|nr:triose-phosphate isomerase [Bacillota bacterium]
MSRRVLAAGNWKMNKTHSQAAEFIKELALSVKGAKNEILICVPFTNLETALRETEGTNISVGAENMDYHDSGAYTGEISADMLVDLGVKYIIIGHSERREYYAESDKTVNLKVLKALEKDIVPVLCCGESLEQREDGITAEWVRMQIKIALKGVSKEDVTKVVIAYEPIWAIGTGKTATNEQANEVCAVIRDCIKELYGEDAAEATRILYGGSVNAGNAKELFSMSDIDGGLVGGASLKVAEFTTIVNA